MKKVLIYLLICVLCFFIYKYIKEGLYTINNISLLIGSAFSIIICTFSEKKIIEKIIMLFLVILIGAGIGLGLLLWPLTISTFLILRVLDSPNCHSLSYIMAQITVEGSIILLICLTIFGLIHLIKYIFF